MISYRDTLVDDDGVLVVSTARQMAAIGSQGFDYDFPAELIELMNQGRIVAWETGDEGNFCVEVDFAEEPPSDALGGFLLDALESDIGIVMPYSQFSYAADCAEGSVTNTSGLALRFPLAVGKYHIFVSRLDSAASLGFKVTLTPPKSTLATVTGDLPLIRANRR